MNLTGLSISMPSMPGTFRHMNNKYNISVMALGTYLMASVFSVIVNRMMMKILGEHSSLES